MHRYCLPVDPPGTENRRWQCQYCHSTARLSLLHVTECPKSHQVTNKDIEEILKKEIEKGA